MVKPTAFIVLFGHFFLLNLVVNDVVGSQFIVDVLQRNAHLDHQHHNVIGKIGNFVNGFLFVVSLTRNDDFGTFLAHLFKDLVNAFFKEIGGIGTFLFFGFSADQHGHELFEGEFVAFFALEEFICEAAFGACVAGSAANSYSKIKNAYYISGSATTESKTQYGVGHSEEGKVRSDLPGVTMGITLQDAKLQQTYAFDFEADWQMGSAEEYAYPVLQMLHHGDHVFDQQTVSDTLQRSPADCQSGAIYYYSCTCGNISDKTFTYGDLSHTVNSRWASDDIRHWHACALCEVKLDISDHTFGKSEIVQQPSGDQEGKLMMKCTECQKEVVLSFRAEQTLQSGQTQSMRKSDPLFTAVFIGVGAVTGGLLMYGFMVVRDILRKRQ